ncbi:MAG: hypothetical protein ABI472_25165 [Ginsengibacter sp.]
MKPTSIFLLLSLFIITPVSYLAAQNKRDSTLKKTAPDYRISNAPRTYQNKNDTIPKPPVQIPPPANDEDRKPRQPTTYIIPDTVRPVPVETQTYIGSVLRLQKIYVNEDALELIRLLNPDIANKEIVMSDQRLVLPEFPEPDSRSNKSVNQQFKKDLDPDNNTNIEFAGTAMRLDTLAAVFVATAFETSNDADQRNYGFIKSLLPALADLNKRAINKIKHTSRITVNTLTIETNALNNVLSKCNISSSLSGENIGRIYSLVADMNILLSNITDRNLQLPREWDHSFNYETFKYTLASYEESPGNNNGYTSILSDDDPRKFNIYVFRRSLVASGIKDPEMNLYRISYVVPALAVDPDGWDEIPEPASTVHCYFPPARFKFTITDTRSNEEFSATEDLYDAQKDPNQKWTILSLLDRHPTYRLIFLLP